MPVRCKRYVVARGYIRGEAPLTKSLREIINSGGRFLWKDEISRRVVFRISPKKLLQERFDFGEFTYEYNLLCIGVDKQLLLRKKKIKIINKSGRRIVAYAVIAGRYVLLELKNNKLYVKIGVKSTVDKPPLILPPSAFLLRLEDLAEIEDNLNIIRGELMGGGGCKPRERTS